MLVHNPGAIGKQPGAMAEPSQGGATQRVRQRVGVEVVALLEEELSSSDLTTLLLSVAAKRAGAVTAGRLLSLSAGDRFTRAAAGDARVLTALEHRLWQLLPERFEAIELSPLAPLGIFLALAGVAQNRVVTTMRGSEVVSDATARWPWRPLAAAESVQRTRSSSGRQPSCAPRPTVWRPGSKGSFPAPQSCLQQARSWERGGAGRTPAGTAARLGGHPWRSTARVHPMARGLHRLPARRCR